MCDGWTWTSPLRFGDVDPGDTLFVRASTSILVFSIGSMFILFAMLFDMQVNESKEVQVRE